MFWDLSGIDTNLLEDFFGLLSVENGYCSKYLLTFILALFIFISLLFLSNCVTSPNALLGPIFTGAKTGSVYQASLSYGSNRIISKIREFDQVTNCFVFL